MGGSWGTAVGAAAALALVLARTAVAQAPPAASGEQPSCFGNCGFCVGCADPNEPASCTCCCDPTCVASNDCCDDYETVCVAQAEPPNGTTPDADEAPAAPAVPAQQDDQPAAVDNGPVGAPPATDELVLPPGFGERPVTQAPVVTPPALVVEQPPAEAETEADPASDEIIPGAAPPEGRAPMPPPRAAGPPPAEPPPPRAPPVKPPPPRGEPPPPPRREPPPPRRQPPPPRRQPPPPPPRREPPSATAAPEPLPSLPTKAPQVADNGVDFVSVSFSDPPDLSTEPLKVLFGLNAREPPAPDAPPGPPSPPGPDSPPGPPGPRGPPSPESFAPGMQDWSFSATVDLCVPGVPDTPDRIDDAGNCSIGVSTEPFGSFAVGAPAGFPEDAEELHFCLKPTGGGYIVEVILESTEQGVVLSSRDGLIFSSEGPGDSWRCILVDLQSERVRQFLKRFLWDKLTFQDASGRGSEFQISDIAIIAPSLDNATAPPPPGPGRR